MRMPTRTARRSDLLVIANICWVMFAAGHASSAEPIQPLSQRFAEADTGEVPDFQKHVIPLLGKLGCNGRACHGSFQGRGGFQLSLFGYDFSADHKAMLDQATGRIDLADIEESLILTKPTDADIHEGGKRFDQGSWQHHVLRRWIQSGAKFRDKELLTLDRLQVLPSEIQFDSPDDIVQLKVIAHWDEGTSEDVTQLSRFHSNNDAIATIDQVGQVSAVERGDTHVVVSYDNAVVPVQVIRPFRDGLPKTTTTGGHPIDQLVQTKLAKLGIEPSGPCTDAEFIRRATLDITGILPSGQRVREFLDDESPEKRAALIDQLLDSPGYAAWWATRFSDWTGNNCATIE